MVSRVIPVDVFDLVIFGGTGDLARRKILPGLYRRFLAGQMPGESRIIGAARGDLTDADYRAQVAEAIRHGAKVMVCGGRDMASGVAEALTDILAPTGLTPLALKAEGRYAEDIY